MKGTVKWFNDKKGYGFITSETGEEHFVHYSNIQCDGFKTLKEGQEVEFSTIKSDKGIMAVEVKPM